MPKTIVTFASAILGCYALLVTIHLPSYFESRQIDSGVTYAEFIKPFEIVHDEFSEAEIIENFGLPDHSYEKEGTRTIEYYWHDLPVNWYFGTSGYRKGGINFHFQNGRLSGIGYSDSPD